MAEQERYVGLSRHQDVVLDLALKQEGVKDASRLMCIPELAGFIQFYWRIFYHQFHRFSNEHIHGLNIITM